MLLLLPQLCSVCHTDQHRVIFGHYIRVAITLPSVFTLNLDAKTLVYCHAIDECCCRSSWSEEPDKMSTAIVFHHVEGWGSATDMKRWKRVWEKLCSKTWARGKYSTHRTATERENLRSWARDSLVMRKGALRRACGKCRECKRRSSCL